jgi:hypothetical protein
LKRARRRARRTHQKEGKPRKESKCRDPTLLLILLLLPLLLLMLC